MREMNSHETAFCSGGETANCDKQPDGSIECVGNEGAGMLGGNAWFEGDNGSWASVDSSGNIQNGNYTVGGP
jgi:hypothetical protein